MEANEDACGFVAVRAVELVDVAARGPEADAREPGIRGSGLERIQQPGADASSRVRLADTDAREFDVGVGALAAERDSDHAGGGVAAIAGLPSLGAVYVGGVKQLWVVVVPRADAVAVPFADAVAQQPVDRVEVRLGGAADGDHVGWSGRAAERCYSRW